LYEAMVPNWTVEVEASKVVALPAVPTWALKSGTGDMSGVMAILSADAGPASSTAWVGPLGGTMVDVLAVDEMATWSSSVSATEALLMLLTTAMRA
jgi:hypothetical protein